MPENDKPLDLPAEPIAPEELNQLAGVLERPGVDDHSDTLSFKEYGILFQYVTGDEVAHLLLLVLLGRRGCRRGGFNGKVQRLVVFGHGHSPWCLHSIMVRDCLC